MARPASPLTLAIRELCDKSSGAVTHAEARPLLEKRGFPIAPQPSTPSEQLHQWQQVDSKFRDPDPTNQAAVKAYNDRIAEKCGFDRKTTNAVLAEMATRQAFADERNNFDVTKYNWRSSAATPSRKPSAPVGRGPGRPRKIVEVRRGPGRPRKIAATMTTPSETEISAALNTVEKVGGLGAVQTRVQELNTQIQAVQAEIAQLEQASNMIAEFQKRLKAAA